LLSPWSPEFQRRGFSAALLRFGDVHWVDSDGATRNLDDYRGRPVVMTLGLHGLRKTCSSSMLVMRKMQEILARQGRDVAFVVVSYDPRATPRGRRRYPRHAGCPRAGTSERGPRAARPARRFPGDEILVYDEHVMHDFRIVRFDADGIASATSCGTASGRAAKLAVYDGCARCGDA